MIPDAWVFLGMGLIVMYQWILGQHYSGALYVRKQWRQHECMNSYMEGTYDCPYCYPDDYVGERD